MSLHATLWRASPILFSKLYLDPVCWTLFRSRCVRLDARVNCAINHAGHQMHQTTTCVHIPLTIQPKAAPASRSSTPYPHTRQMAHSTAAGDSRHRAAVEINSRLCCLPSGQRLTKLKGEQMRPTRRESEKLRVANVDRVRPRRSMERNLIRMYCCGEGGEYLARASARR